MKNIAVIYHANCPDGFSGAWAAYKKLGKRATYLAVSHEQPPLNLKNKEIYFVDLVYKAPVMKKLISQNKKVVVIDHHLTARESAKLASESLFDINQSGAVLAWRYFHSREPLPKLLRYVEDSDLWQFKLSHSRQISAFLKLAKMNFSYWNKLARDFEKTASRRKYLEQGKIIWEHERQTINAILKDNTYLVKFAGHKILAANAPHFLASHLGHILSKKHPPFSITWNRQGDGIGVSLRSNGKINVAKIAKRYGGGGHKAAAGFFVPNSGKVPWKVVKL